MKTGHPLFLHKNTLRSDRCLQLIADRLLLYYRKTRNFEYKPTYNRAGPYIPANVVPMCVCVCVDLGLRPVAKKPAVPTSSPAFQPPRLFYGAPIKNDHKTCFYNSNKLYKESFIFAPTARN